MSMFSYLSNNKVNTILNYAFKINIQLILLTIKIYSSFSHLKNTHLQRVFSDIILVKYCLII